MAVRTNYHLGAIIPDTTGVPTLVQHVHYGSNVSGNADTCDDVSFNLPNATLSGNCLLIFITTPYSATRTLSWSDNIGGHTYSLVTSAHLSAGSWTTYCYVVANVSAGVTRVTVDFDGTAGLTDVQATVSEYRNIAQSSPVDVYAAATEVARPSLATGSMTTTVDGDLIVQYALRDDTIERLIDVSQRPTGYTAASGWELLSADRQLAVVLQHDVQASAGAVNPTITVGGGDGTYSTIAVALRSAAAGTAPAAGIHINRAFHGWHLSSGTSSPLTWDFPSSGNLIVLMTSFFATQDWLTISDTASNTWTDSDSGAGYPRIDYAANATTGPTLKVTTQLGSPHDPELKFILLDISGAATSPFDVEAHGTGSTNANPTTHMPDITPTTSNGLVISTMYVGTGPVQNISPGQFIAVTYPIQRDDSLFDCSDGYGIYYNPNTDAINTTWTWGGIGYDITGGYTARAIAFKGA